MALSNPLRAAFQTASSDFSAHAYGWLAIAARSALRLGREDDIGATHFFYVKLVYHPETIPLHEQFSLLDVRVLSFDEALSVISDAGLRRSLMEPMPESNTVSAAYYAQAGLPNGRYCGAMMLYEGGVTRQGEDLKTTKHREALAEVLDGES